MRAPARRTSAAPAASERSASAAEAARNTASASSRPLRARISSGSVADATSTVWRFVRRASASVNSVSSPAGGIFVAMTTNAEWRTVSSTASAALDQSVTSRRGFKSVNTCASVSMILAPRTPETRARTRESTAMTWTLSPARSASAARSRAVSIEESRRGARPSAIESTSSFSGAPSSAEDARPQSTTMTTWRSRSGRHWRTMSSVERADARQSMSRGSSPTTYARSESNSVPAPRSVVGVVPSSSWRRANRDGRSTRALNSGSTDRVRGALIDTWRAPRCRGPQERIVTTSAWRVPRLVGDRSVVTFSADFGSTRTRRKDGD